VLTAEVLIDSDDGTPIRVLREVDKVFLHACTSRGWRGGFSGATCSGVIRSETGSSLTILFRGTLSSATRGAKLAAENGRVRQLTQIAGGPDPAPPTDVLMCGFVKGEGRIVQLYDDGTDETVPHQLTFAWWWAGRTPSPHSTR